MELLRTSGVVKRHGHCFQLGPVDLALRSGEVLGIIGKGGSGKTTLLKLIWGFLRPDQGTVSVFDRQPHLHQLLVRQHTGYLAESPSFEGWMTVRDHVRFTSHYYEGWSETAAESMLDRFGIDPVINVGQLSESARIKLALISAAGHSPFLLLLDDPMARLDAVGRREISEFLRMLAKDRGIGVVVSARYSSDLNLLTDSMLTLIDGKPAEAPQLK